MTHLLTLGGSFPFSQYVGLSWLLNLIETITRSVVPKPVYLLTVQEAHKEYNSLTDQIQAKYEKLDSGKYGSVDNPAFKAEACELANLLAHVSQLCQKLNLPTPKELYRPRVLQALKTLFRLKLH